MFHSKLKSRFAVYRNNPANSSPAIAGIKRKFRKDRINKTINETVLPNVQSSNTPIHNLTNQEINSV